MSFDLNQGRTFVAVKPSGRLRDWLMQQPSVAFVHHSAERPSPALIRRVMALRHSGVATVILCRQAGEGSAYWLRRSGVRELTDERVFG